MNFLEQTGAIRKAGVVISHKADLEIAAASKKCVFIPHSAFGLLLSLHRNTVPAELGRPGH